MRRPVLPCLRLLPLVLAASASGGCNPKCEFEPHCEGNVVNECQLGVDQLVGSGTPVIYPCLEPAPLCVERRPSAAPVSDPRFFCARAPLVTCEASFVPTCEGTVRVSCQGGYVTADDCTNQGQTGRCGQRKPELPVDCL